MHLKHMILSHHGDYSIIKPKTLEAEILIKLDLIDSKTDIYKTIYSTMEGGSVSDKNYYFKMRVCRT